MRRIFHIAPLRPRKYHADHVIPYSLWQNNDLWNLLPVKLAVNLQKSDKIPARDVLTTQKPRILYYWNELNRHFPKRFAAEAAAQTGETRVSLPALFDNLLETAEVTALQRGCERWAPKG